MLQCVTHIRCSNTATVILHCVKDANILSNQAPAFIFLNVCHSVSAPSQYVTHACESFLELAPVTFLTAAGRKFTERHLFFGLCWFFNSFKTDDMKNIDAVGLNIESY